MGLLKKILVFAFACGFYCCKHKPGNAKEKEKPVDIKDFMGMFAPIKLPIAFEDSSLSKKHADSAVAVSTLLQFIPDSSFRRYFGKPVKTKFYASGKVVVRKAETYLFLKSVTTGRKTLYLLGFDKNGQYKAALPLLVKDEESNNHYSSSMDGKYTITVNRQRRDEQGRNLYKKSVYVFNDPGVFSLIMTESNEQKSGMSQIFNPIDTLPHRHKYTGDYIQDKRNFISVRDGRNSSMIRFFVHFEKEKGECTGELKGEARFISPAVARYSANGDPCSVEFSFSDKNVRMKELEGCGNHRGIRCYFEGTYDKHKTAKAKPDKQKPRRKPIK